MSECYEPTEFEAGFELIKKTFQKYAKQGDGGSADKLEKDEMKELIQKEFRGLLGQSNNVCVDELFKDFDEDNSESVDFVEFLKIIAKLASDAGILERIASES